jgi:hypothetical protein
MASAREMDSRWAGISILLHTKARPYAGPYRSKFGWAATWMDAASSIEPGAASGVTPSSRKIKTLSTTAEEFLGR